MVPLSLALLRLPFALSLGLGLGLGHHSHDFGLVLIDVIAANMGAIVLLGQGITKTV